MDGAGEGVERVGVGRAPQGDWGGGGRGGDGAGRGRAGVEGGGGGGACVEVAAKVMPIMFQTYYLNFIIPLVCLAHSLRSNFPLLPTSPTHKISVYVYFILLCIFF